MNIISKFQINTLVILIATLFSIPKVKAQLNFGNGIDGIPSIGQNTIVNSYKKIQGVNGNIFTIVDNSSFVISPYNKVLIINMMTGNYELRDVISVNGLNIELSIGNISNISFTNNSQIIKVPQYSNVTITAGNSITCPAWTGDSGGVICFLVSQSLNLNGGSIDASGRGFFGGPGGQGGLGGAGGPGGYSGTNTSSNGGLSGFGGSGSGGAGWGGDLGYPGTSGASGSAAFYGATPFWPIYGLPCGSTISSCNAANSSPSLLFMGDGGAGGNGGNGKSGAGGGGSKCNQPGIDGGPGGNGGAGGLGGYGGGIIYIKANNINHTNTIINCAGSNGLVGLPGTSGGNGGNGTCQGGGGNGADGGDGGGGGHSGAGGTVKISKFNGSIIPSLVNISGGTTVSGGTGGTGGIGGIQNGNNTGNCSCGTLLPCSFSNLIPFLASPYTIYSIDLQGTSHFIFTYGDSILNLSYSDLTTCGGYFLAELTGTLYENGVALTFYVAQIASMNNNILSSLIDFVNNNTPNLDLNGNSITTANYSLINGCGICAQCVSTLAQNGDPGNSGPTGTQGGNGYFSEDCMPPVSNQQLSFCGDGYLTVTTPGLPANYSYQWSLSNGSAFISPNLNNCFIGNPNNSCNGWASFAQINCAVTSLTGGCSWTQTFDVQLLPDPSSCFNINSVSNICEGEVIPPLIVSQWGPPTGCSLTYQWYVNNVAITGATASSYQPPSNLPEGIYNYSVYCVLNNCWNTCSNFFDLNEQVVIWSQPEINAGIDTIVCSGAIVQLSGTITNGPIVPSSGGVVTGVWSTSGDGTFGNPNSLTTTYTPGLQDIINGSVSITLTSTSPYWNWPCSQVSDSFILTIVTPPVLNAGIDQVICPNQVVSINGSITGNASNLYWIGGTGLYSPNSNSLNINYTPSSSEINTGGFTLVLMANSTICGIISDEITITVNSSPIITNISASNCDFYDWNGITYTESGQYQYQGTSINGCDSIVNLNLTIFKSFELSSNVTNCGPYTWPVNNQTYTQSGIYNFQALTIAGCDSTIILNLNVLNIPSEPIIEVNNSVDLSSTNQSNNVNYQWVLCPDYIPIANATSSSYTVTNTGNFALIASNDCGTDTSNCVAVSISGTTESNLKSLHIYPNPASNVINIDYVGEITKVEISDLNGKIIFSDFSSKEKYHLPISINPGIYLLSVYTMEGIFTEKLIINY